MSNPLDSYCSQSEERDALGKGNGNLRNAIRIRRSRSKSAVCYPEDSDIGVNVKRMAKVGMYTDRIGSSDFSDRIGLDPIRSDPTNPTIRSDDPKL